MMCGRAFSVSPTVYYCILVLHCIVLVAYACCTLRVSTRIALTRRRTDYSITYLVSN